MTIFSLIPLFFMQSILNIPATATWANFPRKGQVDYILQDGVNEYYTGTPGSSYEIFCIKPKFRKINDGST
jgi:hypothetical protein